MQVMVALDSEIEGIWRAHIDKTAAKGRVLYVTSWLLCSESWLLVHCGFGKRLLQPPWHRGRDAAVSWLSTSFIIFLMGTVCRKCSRMLLSGSNTISSTGLQKHFLMFLALLWSSMIIFSWVFFLDQSHSHLVCCLSQTLRHVSSCDSSEWETRAISSHSAKEHRAYEGPWMGWHGLPNSMSRHAMTCKS